MTETLKKNVVAVTEGDRKVEPVSEKTGGLTKRDWFAGKALQGLLAGAGNFVAADFQVRSRNAFEIADAMIAEMRKGEDDQTS